MSKEYHGWAMKWPDWNRIDAATFRPKRSKCIEDFCKLFGRYSWRQLRARGWRCVKVKLVEVGNEGEAK